jgi:hypothetical protein
LCFSFTDPGGRELRESERKRKRKEKKKKQRFGQGYLPLLLPVPSQQQLPDPVLGCYVL